MVFFGKDSDALYMDAHMPNADMEDKIVFMHTSSEDCAKEFGATTPSAVFFRKFEDKVNIYPGKADKDEMSKWFKPLMVPTLFKFTEDEIEAVFGQQQNTLILFRDESHDNEGFVKVFEEASKTFKGKMLFSFSDKTNDIQTKLADFMGVTDADLPTLRAIMPAKMTKYIHETAAKDITVDGVGKWIDSIISGSIKPHLKSEPVPEKNDEGVLVLVGSEFEKVVMDPTKDVLVKYYAPWCGHCKKLAPIWDELGELYKDNKNLVIAKFDATLNEAEGVNIRGYPTLIWYPRDNKEGVNYEGERDLEGLKAYISENSGVLKGSAEAKKDDL